jgi:hypothetical protein
MDLLMAQGALEDGIRSSSVGLEGSAPSMLTTPHVDCVSTVDLSSSGINASPLSVSLASRASLFSVRDLVKRSL